MKKALSSILVFVLCLSLCACGKSEAVKNVEAMIEALDEITLESIDAIEAAEAAYAALPLEEQEKVKNYETLTAARDRYYELALVGEWCSSGVHLYDLPSNYERIDIILNADMTAVDMVGTAQEFTAKWSVKDCHLTTMGDGIGNNYDVVEEDGKIRLKSTGHDREWMKRDDYLALLDDAFLIVDISEVDLTEYFGFAIHDLEETDEWDEPTGYHILEAILVNQLYDQGWLYLSTSDDFAVEILYPEFHNWITYSDGHVSDYTTEAGSYSFTYDPFNSGLNISEHDEKKCTVTTDLTPDQISFGRAKGTIVFINSKYVSEVARSEDGHSSVLNTAFSEEGYFRGYWYDDIQY